jgi:hypothetical protein
MNAFFMVLPRRSMSIVPHRPFGRLQQSYSTVDGGMEQPARTHGPGFFCRPAVTAWGKGQFATLSLIDLMGRFRYTKL